MTEALGDGRVRLVFVLDSVPRKLVRLVGYLEAVSELVIDLVSVSRYDIRGRAVLVPQRIDPGREDTDGRDGHAATRTTAGRGGEPIPGSEVFAASIDDDAATNEQPRLRQLLDWVQGLREAGHLTLSTYRGTTGRLTLLPRLVDERVGLVTIWHEGGRGYLQFWRSVFERRAPESIPEVERLLELVGARLGQGITTATGVTGELLDVISAAYRQAADGQHGHAAPETSAENGPDDEGGVAPSC